MELVGSNILSLKYLGCTTSGCRDIGIKKSEFAAETQFLFKETLNIQWLRVSGGNYSTEPSFLKRLKNKNFYNILFIMAFLNIYDTSSWCKDVWFFLFSFKTTISIFSNQIKRIIFELLKNIMLLRPFYSSVYGYKMCLR